MPIWPVYLASAVLAHQRPTVSRLTRITTTCFHVIKSCIHTNFFSLILIIFLSERSLEASRGIQCGKRQYALAISQTPSSSFGESTCEVMDTAYQGDNGLY